MIINSLLYSSGSFIWFRKSRLCLFSIFHKNWIEQDLADDKNDFEIVSINISQDKVMTVCCTNKFVYLVKLQDFGFSVIGRYLHPKKVVASLKLSKTDIVVLDKFGDVYLIPTSFFVINNIDERNKESSIGEFHNQKLNENELIETVFPKMGHLSSITCLIRSSIFECLFVGNKCGKIWVSNSINLGHTVSILCGHNDSITSLCEIQLLNKSNSYLVSSSIDKKIKIWNYFDSIEIDSIDIEYVPLEIRYSESIRSLFIRCENLQAIIIIGLESSEINNVLCFSGEKTTLNLDDTPSSIEVHDSLYDELLKFPKMFHGITPEYNHSLLWYTDNSNANLHNPILISSSTNQSYRGKINTRIENIDFKSGLLTDFNSFEEIEHGSGGCCKNSKMKL